jgi:hypothetical protein
LIYHPIKSTSKHPFPLPKREIIVWAVFITSIFA